MTDSDHLAAFVRTLDPQTLSKVLLELAAEHDDVRKRLERLQLSSQPRQLAAVFRSSLNGWRRSGRFIGYRDARSFAAELEGWLCDVERELLPSAPAMALELVESFIQSDAKFFERADDSDGCIGDAVRSACTLWLRAASKCEAPKGGWPERLYQLAVADDYGAREPLLSQASLVLDEPGLRALAARFEADLVGAMQAERENRALPRGVFAASGALQLLSEALRDPDLHVNAVLRHSSVPNALQKAEFVRAYLECDRPGDALKWLDGNWAHLEDSRLRLLADTYARQQRFDECAGIRQRLFDTTGTAEDFRAWRALLGPELQPEAEACARRRADRDGDPVTAARLLLEIGDAQAAESVLVARADQIDGKDYPRLVPLAEEMKERGRPLGATACYRALLSAILARAYMRAYGHGANYLSELRTLARAVSTFESMESHASFEASIRSKHGRKVSFWKHVEDNRPRDI